MTCELCQVDSQIVSTCHLPAPAWHFLYTFGIFKRGLVLQFGIELHVDILLCSVGRPELKYSIIMSLF